MPKSEAAKLAKLVQTMKGCVDILLLDARLDPTFKEICRSMYPIIKRDLFFVDKSPQLSAFLFVSELLNIHYNSSPIDKTDLIKILRQHAKSELSFPIDLINKKEYEEFRNWLKKFYENIQKIV